MAGEGFFQTVYRVVAGIPRGRVASYALIAGFSGKPGAARMVGWALRAMPRGSPVPWHRVVSSRGTISLPSPAAELQRAILESEGVDFDEGGRIDLKRFGWDPQAD